MNICERFVRKEREFDGSCKISIRMSNSSISLFSMFVIIVTLYQTLSGRPEDTLMIISEREKKINMRHQDPSSGAPLILWAHHLQ